MTTGHKCLPDRQKTNNQTDRQAKQKDYSPRLPRRGAAPRSIETLGEAILNLSGQIDLPITLETSHYLFTICIVNLMNLKKYTAQSHRLIAMYKYIHIQWQREMYNN